MAREKATAKRAESVSALTRKYITENISINTCLRRGLINYSALARLICDEYGISNFDAVVVACRRYYSRLKGSSNYDSRVISLIDKAKIRVRTKIAAITLEKMFDLDRLDALQQRIRRDRADFIYIEGESGDVIITNHEYVTTVREMFKNRVVKAADGLAQITMIFDERIEETPGVVAFVYGLLADHRINIVEEMSCWRDLILIVNDRDVHKATRLLTFTA